VIVLLAGALWLFLLLNATPELESNLKLNFPKINSIEELRAKFLFNLNGVTEDSSGLVAGLAIGERGLISETLSENMKELSLTHLVAVSGANLAIIAAVVFLTASLFGAPRFWRFTLAYLSIAAYILLVGPESSVLRAGTMAAFVMAGWWLGRKVNPLVPLSWAVLFLLLVDPALAVDIGFALSVFATLGLLVLAGNLHERLEPKLGTWLSLGVSASVAAQLYTLPVLLILQPSIPVYSVLANLAVEAVVAPVTVLGILAVIASAVSPPVAQLLTWLASFGTWWIETVANNLSQMPLTRIPMLPGAIGIGFTVCLVVGLTLVLVSKHVSLKVAGAICVAVFLVPIGWIAQDFSRQNNFHADWQILNCDVGQGDALLIRSGGKVALVDVGREDEPIDHCLSSLAISHIDLLVLTHFDADHVGGIRGAIAGRSVGVALISGFRDDRPLVSVVSEVLAVSAGSVLVGYSGMSGSLGSSKWRVLSPTFEANEAEDSNDASLVLTFELAKFNVLALGDLGEKGQERLMRNSYPWLAALRQKPLILKVAHHGSKDQSTKLHALVEPDIALVSVGAGNDYGHPTQSALFMLQRLSTRILRTDIHGAISLRIDDDRLVAATGGKLSL
jgi:competence protein ComEC